MLSFKRIQQITCRINRNVNPYACNSVNRFSSASKINQKKEDTLNLSGVYPPITTTFKLCEDIAWKELAGNLEIYEKINFKGYVVQGSNGEYVLLSKQERIDMVDYVRKRTKKLILAGSACEGTRETVDLTSKMADVGADAALVATPCFFKNRMNYTAMMKHYECIAEKSPIPVILYNVPSNTGVEFPLDAIIELAKHPNVIGFKDSGGNITNIGHILQETRSQDFQVLAGSASFLMASLQLGAVGGICALANVLGDKCVQLYQLTVDNQLEEARNLQLSLIAPNQVVTRKYNVPALKYAMDLLGYYGGPCRLPLTDITPAEKEDVKNCFRDYLTS